MLLQSSDCHKAEPRPRPALSGPYFNSATTQTISSGYEQRGACASVLDTSGLIWAKSIAANFSKTHIADFYFSSVCCVTEQITVKTLQCLGALHQYRQSDISDLKYFTPAPDCCKSLVTWKRHSTNKQIILAKPGMKIKPWFHHPAHFQTCTG